MYWGDLDYLLLDLPPGTGDMAMSVGQLLPQSEQIVVTTPQSSTTEVSVRAGMMAVHTKQRVLGVVEDLERLRLPALREAHEHLRQRRRLTGGPGADERTEHRGAPARADPFDVRFREGGDTGRPLVVADPAAPASQAITSLADRLDSQRRGLAGMSLGLTPATRF